MDIALIESALRRYRGSVQVVIAIASIATAYTIFFIGFFSRTPFSHIIIMGAWSTSGILLEVSAKLVLALLCGRLVFYFAYGILRNTKLTSTLINEFLGNSKKSRILQIYLTRLIRKRSNLISFCIGIFLFSMFALNGLHVVVTTLLAILIVPNLLYPLFFRPAHFLSMSFSLFPKRPTGISEDRWISYWLSCLSLIAAAFFYYFGQSLFHARANTFQTLNTERVSIVGSIIAVNGNGVLFLVRNSGVEDWRYSERDYTFYPFSAIESISDKVQK
ncbi:hypothetical protein SAMN06265173_1266 [Thalassovita litoralis]|uniref:Uncharacterized protein n=1 Tax=Thalassovita litoralis TaxID=1010611 RepID=A0A521FAB7_9RHOB|nr:hypothetical protein SAMN06265173_1266 [Thalassovita litoralis]